MNRSRDRRAEKLAKAKRKWETVGQEKGHSPARKWPSEHHGCAIIEPSQVCPAKGLTE